MSYFDDKIDELDQIQFGASMDALFRDRGARVESAVRSYMSRTIADGGWKYGEMGQCEGNRRDNLFGALVSGGVKSTLAMDIANTVTHIDGVVNAMANTPKCADVAVAEVKKLLPQVSDRDYMGELRDLEWDVMRDVGLCMSLASFPKEIADKIKITLKDLQKPLHSSKTLPAQPQDLVGLFHLTKKLFAALSLDFALLRDMPRDPDQILDAAARQALCL